MNNIWVSRYRNQNDEDQRWRVLTYATTSETLDQIVKEFLISERKKRDLNYNVRFIKKSDTKVVWNVLFENGERMNISAYFTALNEILVGK